ncbi:MAG TPA: hypothetical protein VK066_28685 [Chloroflexota bacterium]|nr:hypothetical protein [Chloroflexota bacterium]
MDRRPWWERLLDRDSPAGPIIVIILFILVVALVLTIGPMLDRWIEGEQPASHQLAPAPPFAAGPDQPAPSGRGQAVTIGRHAERLV